MTLPRLIVTMVLLPAGLFAMSAQAQYAGYSPERLMEEFSRNLQQVREVEIELRKSREIKQNYTREKNALDKERISYEREVAAYNKDLDGYNAEAKRYDSQCNRKLDQNAFNACEAWARRLEPQKRALDGRLQSLNATKKSLGEKVKVWNDRETDRAGVSEGQLSRYDQYEANIKAIIAALNNVPAIRDSGQNCAAATSPESVRNCMQRILNAARR